MSTQSIKRRLDKLDGGVDADEDKIVMYMVPKGMPLPPGCNPKTDMVFYCDDITEISTSTRKEFEEMLARANGKTRTAHPEREL